MSTNFKKSGLLPPLRSRLKYFEKLNINCRKWFTTTTSSSKMTNRLKNEKSPYLLQHQHNPVDWYSWNPETLALAKSVGKPIFLSSGYSTCHWCHVMERESFENVGIASIMNEHFINIKLDREEHPDIDRIYMTFIQAISGSGGWPMSVWMTPELKPFYGGTYFPPEDRYFGRPGFKALLLSIAEQWADNEQSCIDSSEKIIQVLNKTSILPVNTSFPSDSGTKCLNQLARSYEPSYGGFSEQPKFPQPVNLQFLIQFSIKNQDCFKMVEKTLKMMRKGGIYDHLGEGFSRYSTDKKWHVPHFEKMLYDQAQLAATYLHAFLVTKDEFYSNVVREILKYVSLDMSVEEGGFYSAEDADSLPTKTSTSKKEGAFYVWEKNEIDEILKSYKLSNGVGGLNELFCKRYGVHENGNVEPYQDPHDELKKKNVLYEAKDYENLSVDFKMTIDEIKSYLDTAKEKLLIWRNTNRPKPHLDNKFIASWNGLMTSAFAQAGFALGDETYINRAIKSAQFIENNFYINGKFLRTCYVTDEGGITNLESPILGCVDDYCNVIGAYIDLFQATSNVKYLNTAIQMQEKQDELFWDNKNGGYFNSISDSSVIVRMKDDDDGAEPSSNSTSLNNLLRLNSLIPYSSLTNYSQKIIQLLHQFSDRLGKIPITLPFMTSGLLSYQQGVQCIYIIGKNVKNHEMYNYLKNQLIPTGGIIVGIDTNDDNENLKKLIPMLNEKIHKVIMNDGNTIVYVRKGEVETMVENIKDLSLNLHCN